MAGRSRVIAWGLPIVGLAALMAGSYSVAANRPQRPPESPPRQPVTAPLDDVGADAASFIGAVGMTEPPGEAMLISAHTGGIVEELFVAVGDRVQAGDPLFRVDSRRARADLAIAQRRVDASRAEVQALRGQIPTRRADVASAEARIKSSLAGIESARATLAAAEADLADKLNLVRIAEAVDDPRAISGEERDNRRFAAASAEARVGEAQAVVTDARARLGEAEASLEAARAQLGLLVVADGGDGPDLLAAGARVAEAEASVGQAQTALDLLTMHAPAGATVLQVNLRAGEFAPAKEQTEGLIVLGRPGALHVRAQIDEVDIARFREGARAWASPRGDARRRLDATLAYIEPMVVPKRQLSGRTSELIDTRVLEVVYEVDAGNDPLYPGQQMDLYIEAEAITASGGQP
ncbi:MAG: HlyD family efflux transporter periplasmic adaptor subunit [Planctomycetota bacterium]